MLTSASRRSKRGHRRTAAHFWVQKQFHILQQTLQEPPEPPSVVQCPCPGTSAVAVLLLLLQPAPASALAVGWACLLLTHSSNWCLTEHVPSIKNTSTSTVLSPVVGERCFHPSSATLFSGARFHLVLLCCTGHPLLCQPSVNHLEHLKL